MTSRVHVYPLEPEVEVEGMHTLGLMKSDFSSIYQGIVLAFCSLNQDLEIRVANTAKSSLSIWLPPYLFPAWDLLERSVAANS